MWRSVYGKMCKVNQNFMPLSFINRCRSHLANRQTEKFRFSGIPTLRLSQNPMVPVALVIIRLNFWQVVTFGQSERLLESRSRFKPNFGFRGCQLIIICRDQVSEAWAVCNQCLPEFASFQVFAQGNCHITWDKLRWISSMWGGDPTSHLSLFDASFSPHLLIYLPAVYRPFMPLFIGSQRSSDNIWVLGP